MGICIRNSGNQVTIDIHAARLDNYLTGILRKIFVDLIKDNQVNIVINMSLVNSFESNALGCLISAQKKCQKKGGQIVIYGVSPDVLTIFYIIRLDEFISLYSSETDALMQKNMLVRRRFRVVK